MNTLIKRIDLFRKPKHFDDEVRGEYGQELEKLKSVKQHVSFCPATHARPAPSPKELAEQVAAVPEESRATQRRKVRDQE